MFKLHAIQAKFGDCLLLEFGPSNKPRFALIDGGPPEVFESYLDPALASLVGKKGKLDLVVLSHVDNDHVVGLLDLLAALEADDANNKPRRVQISKLWHNSFHKTIDPDGQITQRLQMLMTLSATAGVAMPLATDAFLGVREGHRLRTLSMQLGIAINGDFQEESITVEKAAAVKVGPLTLRVVGPTQANLDELREKWLEWLAKAEAQMGQDPKAAANLDKSVPNLSSIVMLAECDGKTVLLTGDARGDHILSGLKTANLLKHGVLHVDVLKVQHHGSDRNATLGFFEKVTADTYVISADGKHGNPDYATLTWIVKAAANGGRKVKIYVTNETASTKKLLKDFKPGKLGYQLTVKKPNDHSVEVLLS